LTESRLCFILCPVCLGVFELEMQLGVFLLAIGAFWLGACPFSVWIGRWLLGKDIRAYGDGNPGAANVFRAGGRKAGVLAVILDVGKGTPFVILAHSFLGLPDFMVLAVGLSAILGHAFSPILRFKGGKAIGVTMGILIVLPQHYMIVAFMAFMLLGYLLIEIDAWVVMLGVTGSLVYVAATQGSSWELLFMLCVLAVLATKHFADLKAIPRFRGKLIRWLMPVKRQI
jgi:glycerol-3-phosphate acyltransferase PlsY